MVENAREQLLTENHLCAHNTGKGNLLNNERKLARAGSPQSTGLRAEIIACGRNQSFPSSNLVVPLREVSFFIPKLSWRTSPRGHDRLEFITPLPRTKSKRERERNEHESAAALGKGGSRTDDRGGGINSREIRWLHNGNKWNGLP